MRVSSLRPRYLWRRVAQWSFHRRHPDVPWLTENAVYSLKLWLRDADVGFEWGSGRSTVWFAQQCAHVVSVEGDTVWYRSVAELLKTQNVADRVDYRLHECGLLEPENETHPYVRAIDEFADGHFDWILVDGSQRLECTKRAIPKLKPGGLLILDNASWYLSNEFRGSARTVVNTSHGPASDGWAAVDAALKEWRGWVASDGISETRFWVKPTARLGA